MHWSTKASNPYRSATRAQREKNRITVQLQPDEKRAIDWLSRCPVPDELPDKFRAMSRQPARVIARELSGADIAELANVLQNRTPPPSK